MGSTLFFGRMSPREVLEALAADLVARGALHPAQLQRALPLLDSGRIPATALLDVGTAPISVLAALSALCGLPAAPPRPAWIAEARLPLNVPLTTWQALLAAPIATDAGRPVIAFADPSRLGSSLALGLPSHAAVVALEADIKDILAVTPSANRSAVSFLAPPSAINVGTAPSSPAFGESTRPALAGTMVGQPPPPTIAPAAAAAVAAVVAEAAPPPQFAQGTSPFSAPRTATPRPVTLASSTISPFATPPTSAPAPANTGTMVFNGALPPPLAPASSPPESITEPQSMPTSVSLIVSDTELVGAPALKPLASSPPPSTCGPFTLERRLGEGGMATVYVGVSAGPPRVAAAVKIVHEHLLRSTAGEELRRRFQREAAAMKQLQHRNIVGFVDAGRCSTAQGDTEYLATELIPGGALSDLLKKKKKLPPLLAVSIAADIFRGLEHAHQKGVVHRDLKPENLLIDDGAADAPLKIADFGIARLAEGTKLTGTNRIIGTPAYMSPEQAMAGAIDTRTDLYTTGVILYELITGKNPFQGESPMATLGNVMAGKIRPLGDVEPSVPFAVDVVVSRLLQLRPDDRYATASEVLDALIPVLERAKPLRARWAAIVKKQEGAVEAAFSSEAAGWASVARAELAKPDRAACAAFSAFRATSLDPDQKDARAVLANLEAKGEKFSFIRSTSAPLIADEQKADELPLDQRRDAYRKLGDAYWDDKNPRFASQWWRRAVKSFGAEEQDFARLARVTTADEIAELQQGAKTEQQTAKQRAWKPKAQEAKEKALTSSAPAPSPSSPPAVVEKKPLPKWVVPVAVVALVVLAFVAGKFL